jgi:hypothetical protein
MGAALKKPHRVLDLPPDARNPDTYLQEIRSCVIELRTKVYSLSIRDCERRSERFAVLREQAGHVADTIYGRTSSRRQEFEKSLKEWTAEWKRLLSMVRSNHVLREGVKGGSLGERLLDPIEEE